jgi:glycosyltransferase involved in cell wall biosynthesis
LADHVGRAIKVHPLMRQTGETLLRLPAKLAASRSGIREYNRRDCIAELGTALHMLMHRDSTYHFLYGEKSLWMLTKWNGRLGHKVMATFHHPPGKYPEHFRSMAHLNRLAHAVVVSTSQIEFIESVVGRGKVSFVPHGVDTDYFHPAGARDPRRPFRCTFAGVHLRDLGTLSRVIPAILEQCMDAEFVLVHPEDRCWTMPSHPRARWVSRLDDAEYLGLLQATDLMVLPLLASTAVNTALEALACGVPVISNRGGISDYVDASCGVLCDIGDADEMIQATVALLRDSARRLELATAARCRAMQFSWPNCAALMRSVYARL